jgi:DNA-binding transcriptional MerR regulator
MTLTKSQAAARAGVSPRTLDRWRDPRLTADPLPSTRRSYRVVTVEDADLDAFLSKRGRRTQAEPSDVSPS